MRIERLVLERFGPFDGLAIDLAADGRRLHVIYGDNEAGKSTALRALTGLLFGIPERTGDAHRFEPKRLRVSATLVAASGERVFLRRRKGRKDTLLAADDRPIDEGILRDMLRGIDADVFETVFGLDHGRLRQGAAALLAGRGNVGESLFDAASGRDVHTLLTELDREAAAIFTPRGQKQPLNAAIASFRAAERARGASALAEGEWRAKQAAVRDAEARVERLRAQRAELIPAAARLRRLLDALPKADERALLLDKLATLGDGATVARLTAMTSDRIDELRQRLGSHEKAAADRPGLATRLRAAEEEVQELLRRLGADLPPDRAEELRLEDARQALVRELCTRLTALTAACRAAERGRDVADRRRAEVAAELDALPKPRDLADLGRAHTDAVRAGDLEERVAALGADLDCRRLEAGDRLAALPWFDGTLDDLRRLPVPADETVEEHDTRSRELDGELRALRRQRDELARRRRELEEALAAESGAGEVPSEELLRTARAARDGLWQEVLAHGARAHAEFEQAMHRADEIADRLRREAERVAVHAQRAAERTRMAAELAECERSSKATGHELEQLAEDWTAVWRPTGIAPRSPREMRAWLRRREAVLDVERRLAGDRAAATDGEARLCALGAALRAAWPEGKTPPGSFAALVEQARAELDAERRLREQDRRLRERLAELDAERARYREEATRAEHELEQCRAQWRECTSWLRLPDTASPDQAAAVLDVHARLFPKVREVDGLRGRLADLGRDADAFAADVRALVDEAAPDLAGLPVEDQAAALCRRHRTATELGDRLAAAERDLAGHTDGERVEDLIAAARKLDRDAERERLADLERRLDALDDDLGAAQHELGKAKAEAEQLQGRSGAEQAEEAEAALAEVRMHARGYVRARLAAIVLRQEIERHREENQGPILARASTLFRRLTRDGWRGVRTAFGEGDETVLMCVRSDGAEVPLDGLSEGTRDQLYLALRVASIERRAQAEPSLPFVVDDVLIQFDDDRARAALGVLGELAATTQVLFFTHHARLVQLARESVADVLIHELPGRAVRIGSEPAR